MSNIKEIIIASYKELENVPEPYGVFHLTFVALSLVIIGVLCFFGRKSSDRVFRIVLLSVGSLLILSEIYKQLYYFYAAGGEGYDWYIFPFQLCSVPMYLSVAAGMMKKNKVRDAICEYLASVGMLGGIMAYIEPSGILTGYCFTIIHSCIWHALLIFIGVYMIVTDNACRKLKDYHKSLTVLGGVVLTATLLNVIFRSKKDFNMCYISPFYNTPLAVFSDFDTFFKSFMGVYSGRIVSIIIYIVALALGGAAVYSLSWLIGTSVRKRPLVI